jgi:pimeloyl-ACP methyl ester carboxylesterase
MASGQMKLKHHDFGGSGPLLLLLHANGFNAHTYLPVAKGLMCRFRCIALDLPGHGEAEQDLPPNMTPATMAEATHAYLEHQSFLGKKWTGSTHATEWAHM